MVQYYNPDNDLALAAGYANYTAPMAAQRLRQAGALLPMWYGEPGDKVLCYGVNARWWEQKAAAFDIKTDVWNHECTPGLRPSPWGWSAAVKKYFSSLGFGADLLPTDQEIEKMRQLSHRRTASELARELQNQLPWLSFTEAAEEMSEISQVAEYMRRHGEMMAKFPWSSSGRGLANSRMMGAEKALRMAQESISKQGSVMVEPLLEPAQDFALLYECRQGKCIYQGTSIFATDSRGIYIGNELGPEAAMRARLRALAPEARIEEVREALRQLIEKRIAPYYNGILGMDMLITADGRLDAAVELNLRKTMGWVARRFSDLYLHPGSSGFLSVVPGERADADLVVENHRIVSGQMALTPKNPHFSFVVTVDKSQHPDPRVL